MKTMKLKPFLLFSLLLTLPFIAPAQSKTTEVLQKDYNASSFFFYNNTLRMLNQSEDPGFDELIKDIEKMKFLMIKKDLKPLDYKKVVGDYKKELFEEAMSSRHQGKNFDVYLKEQDNKTTGMLVLINDENSLMVLDIVGRIALDQVTNLYKTLDESSDIGRRIRDFSGKGSDKDKKTDEH
jgi:hypothetical protein